VVFVKGFYRAKFSVEIAGEFYKVC